MWSQLRQDSVIMRAVHIPACPDVCLKDRLEADFTTGSNSKLMLQEVVRIFVPRQV